MARKILKERICFSLSAMYIDTRRIEWNGELRGKAYPFRGRLRRDRFESVGKVEVAEVAAMSRGGVGREARTGPRVNGSLRPFVVCVVCEHIDAQIEVRYEARSPSRATFNL